MIRMNSRMKRVGASVVNALLRLLAPLILLASRQRVPLERPRVLVIRCDHIGDAVMATGVFGAFRRDMRAEAVDVLGGPWAAAVFNGHRDINEVLTYATPWWLKARGARTTTRLRAWVELPRIVMKIRRRRYAVAVDLRGDLRHILFFLALSGAPVRVSTDRTGGAALLTHRWPFDPSLHEVQKNAAIVAELGVNALPTLSLPPLSEPNPSGLPSGSYVALSLKGSEPNRTWPLKEAARFAVLLGERHVNCVYVGGPNEVEFADQLSAMTAGKVLSLAGRTSLSEAMVVLAESSAVVAVDSGPMHIASALGVPLVALFGPGDPRECGPWTARQKILSVGAPCGCARPVCDHTGGVGRCMHAIRAETVLQEFDRLLNDRSSQAQQLP